MPFHPINYPALPEDTLQTALALYGKGNTYMRLGDHLDEFLIDLVPIELNPCCTGDKSLDAIIQFYLYTIIQFLEELSNKQLSEAMRNRVDLKYALHLPMNSPNLDPDVLCEFRRDLMSDSSTHQILQNLLDRLIAFGLFTPKQDRLTGVDQLLATVCSINRIDEIVDAMYMVLETLAITDPDWLRQNTIPYWYDRYNRKRRLASISYDDQKWGTRVLQIGEDIRYLLGKIEKSQNQKLVALHEIQTLKQLWGEQYIVLSKGKENSQIFEWRFSKCASCKQYPDY
jgi:transposase